MAGHYAGELPAALEVNTTRLEVRDASSEHYQKWVDYFANGPQATPSFNTPLPEARLSGTQLVGPKFRQGEPNAGGQSEIYDQTVHVYPSDAENGDATDSTISVMARVLHYTSPLAWLFITVDEWEMGVEQVHGGWIRFAWRTRDRLSGRQVDDAVGGAGAFAGGIAAESRYSKLAELHLELHRGTAGAHGITTLAQPGLHGRQRRAIEAVLDYSLPATAGEDADGPLLTDIVRENSLRLSPMDAQDGMQTAPLVDEIINEISSEAIPIGMLAGALQARRIGNVGLRRAAANAGQVAEGIAGAPRGVANLLDEIALPNDAQRALLREAMQSNGTGKIAHHLIPIESLTKYKSLMERAARGGFNINGRNNGILLDAIDHVGGHPAYNRVVLEELGRINRQARGLSEAEVAELIQDAADALRRASDNGAFRPWF